MTYHKVPGSLQMQAADCGATSLKMLLDDLGFYYTLEEIRDLSCIGRDGSSLRDLMNAGAKLGFTIEPVRGDYKDKQFENVPFLLWWCRNHFVVYEGHNNKNYYICDPAQGRRKLSEKEFADGFSGLCLKIVSSPKDRQSHTSDALMPVNKILRACVGSSARPVAVALGISLLLSIPTIATAQFTSFFIDQVLVRGQLTTATQFLWIFFALSGMTALISYTSNTLASQATYVASLLRGYVLIRSLVSASMKWLLNRSAEEVANRPLLAAQVTNSLAYASVAQISRIGSSVIISLVILFINVWLGLIAVLLLAALFFVSKWIDEKVDTDNRKMSIEYGQAQGLALGTLTKLREARAANLDNLRFAQWSGFYTNYVNSQQRVSRYQLYAGLVSNGSFYIANTALIVLGPVLIISKQITLGNFVAVQYLIGLVTVGLAEVPNLLRLYQSVTSPTERLRDLFESTLSKPRERLTLKHSKSPPIINIRNLTFCFDGKTPALDNLNIVKELSTLTLLKSKPGAGKTTLLNLLVGNYDHGSSIVNVVDDSITYDVSEVCWTFLPGNPTFIDGSITDNISLMDPRISNEKIFRAAQLVGLIGKDSTGINYQIKRNGKDLPAYIREQILLARILASPDKIIVVDGFNPSSVDSETVKAFLQELQSTNRYLIASSNLNLDSIDFIQVSSIHI